MRKVWTQPITLKFWKIVRADSLMIVLYCLVQNDFDRAKFEICHIQHTLGSKMPTSTLNTLQPFSCCKVAISPGSSAKICARMFVREYLCVYLVHNRLCQHVILSSRQKLLWSLRPQVMVPFFGFWSRSVAK